MIPVTKSLQYFADLKQPYSYDDQQLWNKLITYHCPTIKETERFFSKIKSYLKSRRQRKYFLTLTTKVDDVFSLYSRLQYIARRYKGEIDSFCIELTAKGIPHIHSILLTSQYPRTRDLWKANHKNSIKCDLLKTVADVTRVKKYMLKDQESDKLLKYLKDVSFEKPINYISN